jgi:hypothetical protein
MKESTDRYVRRFFRRLLGSALGMLAGLVLSASTAHAQLFFFNFNAGFGTTAPSTGSNKAVANYINGSGAAANLYGANGSGLSGAAGDYALSNTNPTGMGNLTVGNGNGGALRVGNAAASALNGSKSFTLAGWFKAAITLGGDARLFDYQSATNNGFVLDGPWMIPGPGVLSLSVNGASVVSTQAYSAVGSWVFFAVTYNSLTNTVNFYQGTTTAVASLVSKGTITSGPVVAPSLSTNLGIGNTGVGLTRPFDGYLDDISIYSSTSDGTGALNLSQIQALQIQEETGL